MKINLVKIEMFEAIIDQSVNRICADSGGVGISETDEKLCVAVDAVNIFQTDSSDALVIYINRKELSI